MHFKLENIEGDKTMSEEKIKIGLIGTGWIGQHHGENVHKNPHAELIAVANPTVAKAKGYVTRLGTSAVVYGNWEEMLKQDDLDAVIIASPNAAHAEQAIAAAESGKHIFLEKPMANTLEDCRKIVDAVKKSGVTCAMGYHRRLNPMVQYAKKLQADGKLGGLVLAESDYIHHIPGDWDIWAWAGKKELAGTPLHGGNGHNIDLLRYFCGEVEEVTCFRDVKMPRKIQMETEDIAVVNIKFESGIFGRMVLFLGPICPFTFTFKLYGTKGSVDGNKVWLDTIPLFYEPGHEEDCIRLPESWLFDNVQGGISETWDKCMDTFINDIRLKRPSFNGAESGFNTAAVAFAALQSAADKCTVKPERM